MSALDNHCALKGKPIRISDSNPFPFKCDPIDQDWMQRIKSNWWGWERDSAEVASLKDFDKRLFDLRDSLVKLGGESACLPGIEEDLDKLFTRGQLWSGHSLKMMRGKPISCHENSCYLWESNQDKLLLATGYALSSDGMWRQHSWCVNPKPRSIQIIETTEPRELYFGFAMNLEETIDFSFSNTDIGVDVLDETYNRYREIDGDNPLYNASKPKRNKI